MSKPTRKIEARFVREGDFIPGLDNGYVFEDPEENPSLSYGRYNASLSGDGIVMIGFHTAEGEEAHIICPDNMPITVERPSGDWTEVDEDDDDDEWGEEIPETPEEARECVHGNKVWFGHECGLCDAAGGYEWKED